VGDIVKVCEDEPFPADLIYIASSNPDGVSFINTMNLDGETNLKERVALDNTKGISTETLLFQMTGRISADVPNMSLIHWNCNIQLDGEEWTYMSLN
jgi:phospholipid-transporting ATPase